MMFRVFLLFTLLSSVLAFPVAIPPPVSAATAKTYLAALTVTPDTNASTYNRNKFKHWIIISGKCDTRAEVLKRDGTGVTTDTNCKVTAGTWTSVYDNIQVTNSSQIDIDHIVPLKEAWVSGASGWTDQKRQDFANDLASPQLVAVSASSNRQKGAKDPANWVPSAATYVCTYIRAWVQVKHSYGLSVDSAEKSALTTYLNGC